MSSTTEPAPLNREARWTALRHAHRQEGVARLARSLAQRGQRDCVVEESPDGRSWTVDVDGVRVRYWPRSGKYRVIAPTDRQGWAADYDGLLRDIARQYRWGA